MHEKTLQGKVAVITGGSKGIGKAIAIKLARLGANIVINYRNSMDAVEDTLKELEDIGVKAIAVKGDISNFNDAEKVIKSAVDNFRSIDILVNNAGITADSLILRMKEEDFDKVIEVNLKGTFNCIRHAAVYMVKKRYGKIINISSVVGLTGNIGQANYAASKAGILGLTKSVARELAPRGINVNAVAPGFIETDMTSVLSNKVKEASLLNIPFNRFGKPEDVGELVAFLSSDESSYITGQVINVDGGIVI
mgnify:FL=1